ncbi:hypothetical protein [Mesorhizobium australafricanum]|uniref:Uncharacterized protein n=1 Tax=Mesorhizobium australafricanum TaxID=3072311 RepID=A0ABU4WTM2_9HYPH|nr:hypothetical protein [Mesorhizobium sp. VK3E]MDX8438335.1 hypothetical protein [Mesorhizobium sp. VK3E]
MDEDLTEDDIRRMTAKLMADYEPRSALDGLSTDEKRMAERLLGRDNTRRLENTGRDERFKYRRPVHVIEYYSKGSGWAVDLLENGRRRPFKHGLDDQKLGLVLDAIRAKGVPVRHFETEGEKQDRLDQQRRLEERARQLENNPTEKDPPLRSARFDILHQLRDFRL